MKINTLFIIFIIILFIGALLFGIVIEQRRKTNLNCEPSMLCKKIKGGLTCNELDLN